MFDTYVTLQGWVGSDPTLTETDSGSVATFRVGSTPRFFSRGSWRDGTTSWFKIKAWRTLGMNVHDSVRSGEAVIIHGRLKAESYQDNDGNPRVGYVVEATTVGHDMSKGTSVFTKSVRRDQQHEERDDSALREVNQALHNESHGDQQLDSEGNVIAQKESSAA